MDKEIGSVYQTTDYSVFKNLLGNRCVDEKRVARIISSINENGVILSPIVVNENMEVIDGQGRLEAFKRLKLPVSYIVSDGVGVKECIALNSYSSPWHMRDYISSYADSGNRSYILFDELLREFPQFGISTIMSAVGKKSDTIKKGVLHVDEGEFEEIRGFLRWAVELIPEIKNVGGRQVCTLTALRFCYFHGRIDNERLKKRFRTYSGNMIPPSRTETALGEIEKIYNLSLPKERRVYSVSDWKRYSNLGVSEWKNLR